MSAAYASALAQFAAPFTASTLLAEAEKLTGLSDWGGPRWDEERFRHDLDCLCLAIESEADISPAGRSRSHSRLITMLVSRLRYLDARKAAAGVDDQRIVAPLVGTGMPRAGTTFLHGLLAQDPASRAVPAWEAAIPAPLAGAGDREQLYAAILAFQGMTAPDVTAIHPFGAGLPEECVFLQEGDIGGLYGVYWNAPSFQAAVSDKSDSGFRWQKGVMQYLQHNQPQQRWVLKGPGHMFAFQSLLMAFPDARIYVNHRDPGKVIPSIASLFAKLRSLFSDQPIDPAVLGQQQLGAWQQAVDRYTDWRSRPGANAQVADVQFKALTADPIGTVAQTYDTLGLPFSAAAREAMERHLERDHHAAAPKRPYSLAEYGLDEAAIEAAFGRYIDHFNITREQRS